MQGVKKIFRLFGLVIAPSYIYKRQSRKRQKSRVAGCHCCVQLCIWCLIKKVLRIRIRMCIILGELDPDPYQTGKLDPDLNPHQLEKQNL